MMGPEKEDRKKHSAKEEVRKTDLVKEHHNCATVLVQMVAVHTMDSVQMVAVHTMDLVQMEVVHKRVPRTVVRKVTSTDLLMVQTPRTGMLANLCSPLSDLDLAE